MNSNEKDINYKVLDLFELHSFDETLSSSYSFIIKVANFTMVHLVLETGQIDNHL